MKEDIKVYVGLDVHKDTIAMAVAEAGRQSGRVIGALAHDLKRLLKALGKLGQPEQVHVVYEAGPTGYGHAGTVACRSQNPLRGKDMYRDRFGDAIRATIGGTLVAPTMALRKD